MSYVEALLAVRSRLLAAARLAVRTGRECRAERIMERLAKVEGLIAAYKVAGV